MWPAWSPTGNKVAYDSSGGISTIAPDGSGAKLIISSTTKTRVGGAIWSPTGSHLAYSRSSGSVLNNTFVSDVYRATADGGSKTNLTADFAPNAAASAWR
jgi:Tol biopolymer transport system component